MEVKDQAAQVAESATQTMEPKMAPVKLDLSNLSINLTAPSPKYETVKIEQDPKPIKFNYNSHPAVSKRSYEESLLRINVINLSNSQE